MRVTEAIKLAGLLGDSERWFTPEAAARGTAIHAAVELDIEGTLDDSTVHETIAPYLESWRLWRDQSGIEVVESECEVTHEALGIVGHPDMIVRFPGSERLHVIDIKSGTHAAWHRIQCALYALAWQATHGGPTPMRGAVHLHGDGKIGTYLGFHDRTDIDTARAVCAVAHFRKENA